MRYDNHYLNKTYMYVVEVEYVSVVVHFCCTYIGHPPADQWSWCDGVYPSFPTEAGEEGCHIPWQSSSLGVFITVHVHNSQCTLSLSSLYKNVPTWMLN